MTFRRLMFGSFVWLGAAAMCLSETAAPRPEITEGDIVIAMHEKGITTSLAQVKMLCTIPSRTEHPRLEAVKIEKLSPVESRVLLHCADARECIPFYAVVTGLDKDQQLSGVKPGGLRKASAKGGPEAPVVKRGSRATLEIVGPEMLITVPVVCLENGQQGERIKVLSTDHTKTYMAEVVGAGLLRKQL